MTFSDRQNWQVILLVLLATGGLPALWLVFTPMTDEHIRVPLRVTAQLAFATTMTSHLALIA